MIFVDFEPTIPPLVIRGVQHVGNTAQAVMPYQFGLSQLAVPVPSISHFLSRNISHVRNSNFQAVGPSPSGPEALARGLSLVLGQSECNPRTLEGYDTSTVEAKAISARISPFLTGITRRKKNISFPFLYFFILPSQTLFISK
jgi:hypothetical protein